VTGTHSWSDGLCAIWGIGPEDVPPNYESFLAGIDPRDRDAITEVVAASRAAGSTFEFAYRVTRPDGDVRSVLCRGRAIKNVRGRPFE
jgi:PAS domain-containing protein